MTETPAFLVERLKTEGEKTATFFAALNADQWQATVYTENAEWRVRDVLAHFISAEKSFLALFENIRNGAPGAPEDFSIDRFNVSQVAKMQSHSQSELLAEFGNTRAETTRWVAALSEFDLLKRGRHPGLGVASLAEMIKMIYLHNQMHYCDLGRVLKK
ncbi:MAG: DinB family protein [Anaerolineales bacterium]|nr:DinB family protein [Anaerolineales bacterium]